MSDNKINDDGNNNNNNNSSNKKFKKSHDNDKKSTTLKDENDDLKNESKVDDNNQLKTNESKTYEGVEYVNSIPREEYYETNPNYKRKFFLRPMDQQPDEFWRKPTKIACYYCGYQFDKYNLNPIPIVTAVLDNGQFEYEHIACIPTCGKSEINFNMRGYRRNEALEAFTLMMNDGYGYAGEIKVVEKSRFKRYGGDLSQERYLKLYGADLDLRMRGTPFIPKTYTLENPFADSGVNNYWFNPAKTDVKVKANTQVETKTQMSMLTLMPTTVTTATTALMNINQELYLFHAQHNHNNRQGYYHFFNVADYLNDIWNSYNRSEVKLFHQLEIDFDRQGYFINDEECFNIQQLVNFLNGLVNNKFGLANNLTTEDSTTEDYEMIAFDDICKNKQDNNNTVNKYSIDDSKRIQINILNKELDILIALLSTQASFAMPYEFLLKMFVNNNNNNNNSNSNNKLLIQSRSKSPKIKFCLQDDDSVYFEMQLNCELIEIDCYSTNKKCADIYATLTFQLGHRHQQLGIMSIIIKNVDNNINFD